MAEKETVELSGYNKLTWFPVNGKYAVCGLSTDTARKVKTWDVPNSHLVTTMFSGEFAFISKIPRAVLPSLELTCVSYSAIANEFSSSNGGERTFFQIQKDDQSVSLRKISFIYQTDHLDLKVRDFFVLFVD